MWHLAGDQSVDFFCCTERATLSAIDSATMLCWMSDGSGRTAEAWAFLDRRLADLAELPRVLAGVRRKVEGFTRPLESVLSAAARGSAGRHFGIKRA